MNDNLKLWYREPAREWVEALPLGNGRLGAMVLGKVGKERIALNEDTLWTGIPKDKQNYDALNHLDKVRKLIFEEKYYEAQELMNEKLLAGYTESYAPLGNLYLDFGNEEGYKNYRRELDLNHAKSNITYSLNDINYSREIFISAPEEAMIIKISADKKESISFKASLDSLLRYKILNETENSIILKGKAPIGALPSYVNEEDAVVYDKEGKLGMNFQIELKATSEDGIVKVEDGVLIVENATTVVLLMVAHTSFNGFNKEPGTEGKDENKLCKNTFKDLSKLSYEEIFENHLREYTELFNRVEFSLGKTSENNIPTNERLNRLKDGYNDLSLIALYFQYGRYLLISSSRQGSQPANLQGIWNEDLRPAWSSNYTVNINTEMNYWPAEVCNLSECHKPLFEMIKDLSITGSESAKTHFGCNGWSTNHNVDLWRYSNTVAGSSEWGFWPMGGAWLCQHLWEHYDFCRDKEFLEKEAYPIMKGAATFLLGWLIQDEDGYLVTCPSTSPENNFLDEKGRSCCASKASTMDIAITRDLFNNCIAACEVLEIDDKFKSKLVNTLKRLPKYKINKYGGVQEWIKDFDEKELGHRHISHLFGLYPGKEITEESNRELFEACKKTLSRRLSEGSGHTGWSCSWIISFYARLKEAELSNKYLNILLCKLTFSNLFCVHPPFQIDGNFGGTAAIAEMLIQSHKGYIEILPALPKLWGYGSVSGLKARGGFEVSMTWENGVLMSGYVVSNRDEIIRLKYSNYYTEIKAKKGVKYSFDESLQLNIQN